jgi:hypothetical protein
MAATGKFCRLCDQPATLRQQPGEDIMSVDGCACGRFEIPQAVWDHRIRTLTPDERMDLSRRIRQRRDAGQTARVVTTDGTVTGRITLDTVRPPGPAPVVST